PSADRGPPTSHAATIRPKASDTTANGAAPLRLSPIRVTVTSQWDRNTDYAPKADGYSAWNEKLGFGPKGGISRQNLLGADTSSYKERLCEFRIPILGMDDGRAVGPL